MNMKIKKSLLGSLAGISFFPSAIAHLGDDLYDHHDGMMAGYYGWGLNSYLGTAVLILLIVLIAIIIQKELKK